MTSQTPAPESTSAESTSAETTPSESTDAAATETSATSETSAATGTSAAAETSAVTEPTATVAITTPQTATKVRVDTPGVTVEIEAHEPLDQVVATAMRVFHEAGGWPQENRYAAGFAQVERRDAAPVQASSMPYAPGPYPVQAP
ncbi:hypothetical protein ACWDV4_23815 [Micromonospora sp. NPDC003197]